jgi:hypothetical protein
MGFFHGPDAARIELPTTEPEKHIHDCTGPDATCPCGYKFTVPPISVSIEVHDGRVVLIDECFNCTSIHSAIDALERAVRKLEGR